MLRGWEHRPFAHKQQGSQVKSVVSGRQLRACVRDSRFEMEAVATGSSPASPSWSLVHVCVIGREEIECGEPARIVRHSNHALLTLIVYSD